MTVQQRIEAYKWALNLFENHSDEYIYVCDVLLDHYVYSEYFDEDDDLEFPEFKAQKPSHIDDTERGAWWPEEDKEVRKQALRNAIALAEATLINS